MSEWLTTGQMIDQLKSGQIAESNKIKNKSFPSGLIHHVTINDEGVLRFCNDKGDSRAYAVFCLTEENRNMKWRILPKYVTFEEAMKALKEGKMINFHHENGRINAHRELFPVWFKNYRWMELLEGKWTIDN